MLDGGFFWVLFYYGGYFVSWVFVGGFLLYFGFHVAFVSPLSLSFVDFLIRFSLSS